MTRKRKIPRYRKQEASAPESPRIPDGAVAADTSQQGPYDTYGERPTYYMDKPFTCVDCSVPQVWTAEQQKWYYEVAKGSIYATAVRCRACRKKRRETLGKTGDPNPIKSSHLLMKRVEQSLAASASHVGFGAPTTYRLASRGSEALDYRNGESILTCWFDQHTATLSAEMLTDDQIVSIVRVPLDGPSNQVQLLEKMQEFTSTVSAYLLDFSKR